MPTAAVLAGVAIIGALSQSRAASNARREQERGIREARTIEEQATIRAEGTAGGLFDEARRGTAVGFNQALGLAAQAAPQQAQLFQGGNVAAQQQLLAGLPQQQAAILGGQIDLSGLQPTQLATPDFSFLQDLRIPDPVPVEDLLAQLREQTRFNAPPEVPQEEFTGLVPQPIKEQLDQFSVGRRLGIPSIGRRLLGGLF